MILSFQVHQSQINVTFIQAKVFIKMFNFSKLPIDFAAFLFKNKKNIVDDSDQILVSLFGSIYLKSDSLDELFHKLRDPGWL